MNIVNFVTYYYMLKKISVLVAYYVLFVNLPYDYSDVRLFRSRYDSTLDWLCVMRGITKDYSQIKRYI